jgi:hypothetical protein
MGGMFTIALFLYGAYNKGTTVIGIMLICHLSTKMLALHNDRYKIELRKLTKLTSNVALWKTAIE